VSDQGVVAAGDRQTARAGAQLLRQGGNVVDAVCAAAFASFVCELPLTGPLGSGVLLHGTPDRGWSVLDFFARVPGLGAAPGDLDFSAIEVDFGAATQEFHVGRGSVAVPGTLRGLLEAHQRHGHLPLRDVVAPALGLARDGFRQSPGTDWVIRLLKPIYTLTPGARALANEALQSRQDEAVSLTNPGLAHLMESLARDPKGALRAIEADFVAAFGPAEGGRITAIDLSRFSPVRRRPLTVPFRGRTVALNPPPSSGGGLVALGLRLAERGELLDLRFGDHWLQLAQVVAEVGRARERGYDARLTEAGFLEHLLSDEGVDAAWRERQADTAERSLGGTTHISVLDGRGAAASLTTSNGEGSGHVLSGWGAHANNFLGEEDINPHGFHQEPPGTPMRTMMTPTLVLADGRPELALGSGGSNRIRSAIFQALLNHLGFELPLVEAVESSRLHVEGTRLWMESLDVPESVLEAVKHAWPGTTLFDHRSMFFGGVHVASHRDGRFTGAGDPRRWGAVCFPEDV
jgi:gamma-glutamyltranspeptidase/glutathione hydrolase